MDSPEQKAREIGALHGRIAAGWFFDGNTTQETYRRVLDGIYDVDPDIMDSLPDSPLSGEWADSYSVRDLARDLEIDRDDEVIDDLACAFDDGFYEAVQEQIELIALRQVPDHFNDGHDE